MATISTTIKLVDNMSSKLGEIQSAVGNLKSKLEELDSGVSGTQSGLNGFDWDTFGKNAEAIGTKLEGVGKKMMLAFSTPFAYIGKKMYGFATDYESAFAGVKKTTDATDEQYAQLYQDLLQISETNPTGFVEAAEIMEMAGQLGVGVDQLTEFTQAYIGLQESTNINGSEGAASLARFLNVTEQTTRNVDRVGSVIVGLGNNFATTEQEILAMATRMGATADLAGFSSAEILAFSAALSSVGINAEAGGSAAGKLMKKMQLAAEVGGSAADKIKDVTFSWKDEAGVEHLSYLNEFVTNGLEMVNYLDTLKSADKVDIADQLGITTEALQNMADSWLLFDQFSEVMGITGDQFLSGWKESPAESMLKFFQGLGNLDADSGNSILAQLSEMDITEIRLSNLVAALAGNSELFRDALAQAYQYYGENVDTNALWSEVAKRYETQESQNAMLANKGQNAMADLGDNIVKAVQPALDKINELLDAFNKLSEADQDKIVGLMGALILTPVAITGIGKVATAVGDIATAVGKFKEWGGFKKVFDTLGSFLSTPVGSALAVAAAVGMIATAINSIPTETEQILSALQDVKITIDQASVDEALAQIKRVQDAADKLAGNAEVNEQYEANSTSVSMGYGTTSMYGTALGYESTRMNARVADTINSYATQIAKAEQNINNATIAMGKATTQEEREYQQEQMQYWQGEANRLRDAMNMDVSSLQTEYGSTLSNLFTGMAKQYPEQAKQLEDAVANYDLLSLIYDAANLDITSFESPEAYESYFRNIEEQMFRLADATGFLEKHDFSLDEVLGMLENGDINWDAWSTDIMNDALTNLTNAAQMLENNPALTSWLATIFSDEKVLENFDPNATSDALRGILSVLDMKSAVDQATENGNKNLWGDYLTMAMSTSIQSVSDTLNSGGSEAGSQLDNGVAAGILGNQSTVISASSAVAQAAIAAFKSALGIHSPSKVFAQFGRYLDEGLALGLKREENTVERAVGRITDIIYGAVDSEAWSDIGVFADLENQKFLDPDNKEIKLNDSDMKKVRQLAEREVINQLTTAEIKVEMNNTNNINSDLDIDGIVDKLEEKVSERLELCAEGVYG